MKIVAKGSAMSIGQLLLLVGIFTKQFYFFSSGSIQIADLMLFSAAIILFGEYKIRLLRSHTALLAFELFVFCINSIYALALHTASFMTVNFYYLYNLAIMLAFIPLIDDKQFLEKLLFVFKMIILVQLLVLLSGRGRSYLSVRYMGTFNDPNQYGFFVFSSGIFISNLSKIFNKPYGIWMILEFILIIVSASTGLLLGFSIMIVIDLICNTKISLRKKALKILVLVSAVAVFFLIRLNIVHLPLSINNLTIVRRLTLKMQTYSSQAGTLWVERGWDRLLHYPEVMLYGSGEGELTRFGGSNMEIHSNFFAPLFYYGIIPTCFFLKWCFQQLHGISRKYWGAYLGLFIESITLYHLRQPFFWMLIVFAGSRLVRENEEKGIRENEADFYSRRTNLLQRERTIL